MRKNALTTVVLIVALVAIGGVLVYRTPNNTAQPVTGEFAGVSLKIEIATSTDATSRGLGGRETVPYDFGMLFVFQTANKYGFWMKDMLVPIDIFWLDHDMRVVSFISELATSTYPNVFYPTVNARYVLETAAEFAKSNSVATGTPLVLQNFDAVLK